MPGSIVTIPGSAQDWLALGAGAGTSAAFTIYILIKLLDWLGARVDKKETAVEVSRAQVDEANATLIAHLQQQITSLVERDERTQQRLTRVEADLVECRRQHAVTQEELAKYRGANQGLGDVRQQAAVTVAADRLQDRKVTNIAEKLKGVGE